MRPACLIDMALARLEDASFNLKGRVLGTHRGSESRGPLDFAKLKTLRWLPCYGGWIGDKLG